MSWGYVAVAAVSAISAASSADTSRKAAHAQTDAINNQMAQDAEATVKAQTDAANAANALRVGQKRALQANTLALGSGDTRNVLSAGATTAQRSASVQPTTSVLGGGAPVTTLTRGVGGI